MGFGRAARTRLLRLIHAKGAMRTPPPLPCRISALPPREINDILYCIKKTSAETPSLWKIRDIVPVSLTVQQCNWSVSLITNLHSTSGVFR